MKPRLLIFIVAYDAEKTITSVIRRIPAGLADQYEPTVLIIDDSSRDSTFEQCHSESRSSAGPFPIKVLFNPVNQGYGGNQKIGYHFAIENGFDIVALLHGDGQYAPERLPELLEPVRSGDASAVIGSRMMVPFGALKGGMPLYKFIGNRILTWIQNKLLHARLSEFHSGYRIYSVDALKSIPFERNTNGFAFDTEILIQLFMARRKVKEVAIPTYYGGEICHVNGLKYAWDVVCASAKARLQELSLFYDRRFDCAPPSDSPYTLKLGYSSPHTMALERIPRGSRILDLGCAGGYLSSMLKRQKGCYVSAMDVEPAREPDLDEFRLYDLNRGAPEIPAGAFDYVLLLDVVEHLAAPEAFLEELRQAMALSPSAQLILSTGNVGCFITRLMLLAGQFNYGKRGILDATHTRLFTFGSLRRALKQAGFSVLDTRGVPPPYPLAIGRNRLSAWLLALNGRLIRLWRGLFSYQIFVVAKAEPTLKSLLRDATEESQARANVLDLMGR